MDYIGEHLLPGQLGRFFIVLSLVSTAVASFAYFMATRLQTKNLSLVAENGTTSLVNFEDAAAWKKLARIAFITEVISVFAVFGCLFYIIHNHLFEYKYAWQHSSRSLEFKYLLACFWEGQEGSFMLWSAWHCVPGLILIRTGKQWEAPVMTVVSFVQFALATMIAGWYIFGWKLGSNPFILLRDSGVLDNAPALHINMDVNQPLRPDYLASIRDGNDLNPLLQNYWMVIHPPVLFLGFASTVVPFAFAIAGLWTKKFGDWIKQALPWALFSAAVLGVGIMMGAMWAYESLTFGGYWAWDPVENASLVPWLVLVSGIHTLLIYKHTGYSLRSTHLFFLLAFGLILYSTFLTRSGILGESSVHAFTDLGMNIQLYLFLYIFIWLGAIIGAKDRNHRIVALITAVVLVLIAYFFSIPWFGLLAVLAGLGFVVYNIQTQVPTIKKEENASSREFWMFIGSLVFFLSAMVIIFQTSLPVINATFNLDWAAPENAEMWYNKIQIFVAIIIAVLSAITQYFKYRETPGRYFWKKILVPTVIAVIVASLVLGFGNINYEKDTVGYMAAIWMAVACSVYTIVANASYIWIGVKGKLKLSGGSVAHVGFGMVLLGILISSAKKEVLSNNIAGIPAPLDKNEDPRENLTLVKDLTVDMGRYSLTYEGDSAHPKKPLWFYKVRFKRKDGKEEFVLSPNAFVNYKGNEGLMSNPDARHYWTHDVFTYITSIANPDKRKDSSIFKLYPLKAGDSLFYSRGWMILKEVNKKDSLPLELFGKDGSLHEALLEVHSVSGSVYNVTTRLAKAKGELMALPDTVTAESLVLRLQKVNPDNSIELGMKESSAVMDYVTLKAYKFPFIRLLWFGVAITALGILMSMVHRIRQNRGKS